MVSRWEEQVVTYAIFALRMLRWRNTEKGKRSCIVFVDLEKAYDRVPKEEIWQCMRESRVGREVCERGTGHVLW